MLTNFKMNNTQDYSNIRAVCREVLTEAMIEFKDTMHNAKLVLLESGNDIDGFGDGAIHNVTSIYEILKEYIANFESAMDKVNVTLTNVMDNIYSPEEKEKIEAALSNIYKLDEVDNATLSSIRFTMPKYTVNTKYIKYVDISGMISRFYQLLDRHLTMNDLLDLKGDTPDFINYVKHLAASIPMTVEIPNDVDYKTFMYSSLRNMETDVEECIMTKEKVAELTDIISGKMEYEEYMDAEAKRIRTFMTEIYNFSSEITDGSLLNDSLNPNVSTDSSMHHHNKIDSNTENFDIVCKYVVTLFDIFSQCVDIYMTAVTETCTAYRDKILDAVHVITFAISEIENPTGDNTSTMVQHESSNYNMEFSGLLNDNIQIFNEAIANLYTVEPVGVLTESAEVLNEAAVNRATIMKVLETLRQKILELTQKFMKTARDVINANKEWIVQIKKFDTQLLKNNKKIEIESYPYWDGLKLLSSIKMPDYSDSDIDLLLNNKGGYYQKYFKGLESAGGDIGTIKNMFRGGAEQTKYNGYQLFTAYPKINHVIDTYTNNATAVDADNKKITNMLNQAMNEARSLNESALFENSIYFENVFYELLNEAIDGPITTRDMDDADNNKNTNKGTPQKQQQQRVSPQDRVKAMQSYVSICYGINGAKMDILEEGYNKCITILHQCTKSNKVNKQATTAMNKNAQTGLKQKIQQAKENVAKQPTVQKSKTAMNKIVNKVKNKVAPNKQPDEGQQA